jgi:hypothetical protein
MKAAKISSDVYNELAKMAFGIYGAESNFGDTHTAVGNLARGANKFLDPKSASSPDYKSKATTYGADENYRSVGLTQLKFQHTPWVDGKVLKYDKNGKATYNGKTYKGTANNPVVVNELSPTEKAALKAVGITSNQDFLDPEKAAIGTVTLLGIRYNEQLNNKQKQDVWKYLPSKWNTRENYSSRVKNNSSYLSFKQLDKKQEGGESDVDMYGNPIIANLKYDQSVNRTYYNPRTNQMIFGNDMPYFLSQEERNKTLAHENRHAWQFANDRTNFNMVHNPEYAFQDRLQKKPELMSTDEVFDNYHNRKQKEIEIDVENFKQTNSQFSFMPDEMVYKKFVDFMQYDNPYSSEGEVQYYQNTGKEFQKGGEFFMAQLGMEKKPYLSYKDFLASIQKDKVVDYKERPQPVVIESTKTVMPETPKKLTKQQAKIVQKDLYEDPFKPEGITSGNKAVDFLYNNEWLMDVPVLGGYIKDKAKEIATNSGGSTTVKDVNQKPKTTEYTQSKDLGYTGNLGFNQRATLIDQYFSEDPLLPKSKYKPTSDYLEFLPTYSVKGYFDQNPKQITQMNDLLNFNTQDSRYKEFLKNKKPIYLGEGTGLPDIIGVDLGGHKTGIGWDDKMNLPYLSVSDAWDFEPSNYSKKWIGNNGFKSEEDNKNDRNKAFMQSYLMHKTGNPFKIYDRFYFNPETKQYIPDEQLKTYQKGGESKPGPLMKAYNRLPSEKKMGGAVVNKKEFGGQLLSNKEIDKKNITMYKNYVKGIIGNETEAVKNYDKLNRIYYNKAKELGMTAANYVMTHVVGNS